MSPDDASNTIITTDYGIDKILQTFSGSFAAGARYGAFNPRRSSVVLPHNAGSWGLIVGSYSMDNSTWFPLGVTEADTSSPQPVFQTVEVNAACDSSNITIYATNWTTSARTIYYALQLLARD